MHLTIDLSEQSAATLEAQARAAHMPSETYLQELVERVLNGQPFGSKHGQPEGQQLKPKKSAYGLLSRYGPGPTEEEMNENRREMFEGLGGELEL